MANTTSLAKSPLSIIAIFAATIEASALASLPLLDQNNQYIYTWFLIGFPPFLTLLFFVTLNFNNRALYSPSDFSDQENFLKSQHTCSSKETADTSSGNPYLQLAAAARAASHLHQSIYWSLPGGQVHVIDCQYARDVQHCLELLEKLNQLSQASLDPSAVGQIVMLVNSERLRPR